MTSPVIVVTDDARDIVAQLLEAGEQLEGLESLARAAGVTVATLTEARARQQRALHLALVRAWLGTPPATTH